jgi:hypothetical protein
VNAILPEDGDKVRAMRVLGVPVLSPVALIEQATRDAGSMLRLVRAVPAQLDRALTLGEQVVDMGIRLIELGERIEDRFDAIMALGEQIDARGAEIVELGRRLDGRGAAIQELGEQLEARAESIGSLGERIDTRGGEIVVEAGRVVDTAEHLIVVLPTLERAIELATPLEGAIDRVGRLVDRLPGGPAARRRNAPEPPHRPEPPLAPGDGT